MRFFSSFFVLSMHIFAALHAAVKAIILAVVLISDALNVQDKKMEIWFKM